MQGPVLEESASAECLAAARLHTGEMAASGALPVPSLLPHAAPAVQPTPP